MHDFKSFFWVLFWICIYSDATVSRVMLRFEKWNYMDMGHLAQLKKGTVVHGGDFIDVKIHHRVLPTIGVWMNRLRGVTFPDG